MCTIIVLLIYFTIKLEGMALRQTGPSESAPRAKLIPHPWVKAFMHASLLAWMPGAVAPFVPLTPLFYRNQQSCAEMQSSGARIKTR